MTRFILGICLAVGLAGSAHGLEVDEWALQTSPDPQDACTVTLNPDLGSPVEVALSVEAGKTYGPFSVFDVLPGQQGSVNITALCENGGLVSAPSNTLTKTFSLRAPRPATLLE